MKTVALISLLLFSIGVLQAGSDKCELQIAACKTEKEVIDAIEKTDFLFAESFETPDDSWLIRAGFYSCDGRNGYLLIRGKKKVIIHKSVPVTVWQNLKNARSKGGYYNFYIKDRYTDKL